ncbi:MAG: hypothetical protein WC582_05360, partial [Patescibacteria group bacterium]
MTKIKNFFKNNLTLAEEITTENTTSTPLDINNLAGQAPEIELPAERPTAESPTSTPLIKIPKQSKQPVENPPQIIEKVLELSNFSISENFREKKIENVQLRMSLAGKGMPGDKLQVDYYFNNAWQKLNEFDLKDEISN